MISSRYRFIFNYYIYIPDKNANNPSIESRLHNQSHFLGLHNKYTHQIVCVDLPEISYIHFLQSSAELFFLAASRKTLPHSVTPASDLLYTRIRTHKRRLFSSVNGSKFWRNNARPAMGIISIVRFISGFRRSLYIRYTVYVYTERERKRRRDRID